MKTEKVSYRFLLRVLLIANIILITLISLAHTNTKTPGKTNQTCGSSKCSNSKEVKADILNSIAVRFM